MTLARRTADVFDDLLGRRFTCHGFLSHLVLAVTMSQKSSLVQCDRSISKALMPDMPPLPPVAQPISAGKFRWAASRAGDAASSHHLHQINVFPAIGLRAWCDFEIFPLIRLQ
jgi:hypothetical protein